METQFVSIVRILKVNKLYFYGLAWKAWKKPVTLSKVREKDQKKSI